MSSTSSSPVHPTSFRSRSDSVPHPRHSLDANGQDKVEDESQGKLTERTIAVVLGASGDLATKKTYPALFGLYKIDLLPAGLRIIGYARTKMTDSEFETKIKKHIKLPEDAEEKAKITKKLAEFVKLCSYIAGPYDTDEGYGRLTKAMQDIEKTYDGDSDEDKHRVFYLALPPSVFIPVAAGLKKNCYTPSGVNRLIVEKPFGKDLQSSRELMTALKANWSEEETFRIDHYLGKEMVKNLLVLRFANVFLRAGFDRNSIDSVQITFKEPFGTEGRGGYFDEFGIIRDILQNHLMQVVSILAMERPITFAPEDIRDEKVKVLRAIPPIEKGDVLLGQYVAANGKPGYLDDDSVPKDSVCPTFAAATCWINNPRWEGVPFILKAGKALNESKVEIRIQYKQLTSGIFKNIARNELVIRIQPNEAVYLKTNVKEPGLSMKAIPTELDLSYKARFNNSKIPEAYESLLLDAFNGDQSNFVRADELDIAWKIFTPILHWIDGKDGERPKPKPYPYGSRGPALIEKFLQNYGYVRSAKDYEWPKTDIAKIDDDLEK